MKKIFLTIVFLISLVAFGQNTKFNVRDNVSIGDSTTTGTWTGKYATPYWVMFRMDTLSASLYDSLSNIYTEAQVDALLSGASAWGDTTGTPRLSTGYDVDTLTISLYDTIYVELMDSLADHLDSLQEHNLRINLNLDSITAHNLRIIRNWDTAVVHRTAINSIYDSLGNIYTEGQVDNLIAPFQDSVNNPWMYSGGYTVQRGSGNVGIGTASPAYPLVVKAVTPTIELYDNTTSKSWRILGEQSDIKFTETGVGVHMVILNGGDAGLGSTAPDKKLEINTGASDNGIRISYNDADGSATNYSDIITGADGDLTITTVDADGALGHIALMPDGNVGVGTTSPDSTLTVTGSAHITTNVKVDGRINLDCYGTMGFADSSFTIPCTQNVYSKITNTWKTLYTTGVNSGLTFQGDTIQVPTAGNYSITWDLSFLGANTDSYHITIWVNNVQQRGKGEAHRDVSVTKIGTSCGSTILTLTADAWISLRIMNDANSNDATVQAGNITVQKKL